MLAVGRLCGRVAMMPMMVPLLAGLERAPDDDSGWRRKHPPAMPSLDDPTARRPPKARALVESAHARPPRSVRTELGVDKPGFLSSGPPGVSTPQSGSGARHPCLRSKACRACGPGWGAGSLSITKGGCSRRTRPAALKMSAGVGAGPAPRDCRAPRRPPCGWSESAAAAVAAAQSGMLGGRRLGPGGRQTAAPSFPLSLPAGGET